MPFVKVSSQNGNFDLVESMKWQTKSQTHSKRDWLTQKRCSILSHFSVILTFYMTIHKREKWMVNA